MGKGMVIDHRQGFHAHKTVAFAAYRDMCQTKRETQAQGHVQHT